MADLSHITRPKSLKRPYRRVGRGQSSTRGKQSGRGGKGQTARAGAKIRPALRDIIKKIPKRRGFGKNRGRTVWGLKPRPIAVTLAQLEAKFDAGAEITPKAIVEKGILSIGKGRIPAVKIVGADVQKKFTVKDATVSAGAKAAIEKAGGSIA
ncbi:MAG TPA: uL15 family ribosomal protein [Candidatus Paceibacterota bacterium]|nr:uL15 family ribosomal protein [Candidatus Paceibacterota bacterium]